MAVKTPELQLLLACSRVNVAAADEGAIREMLRGSIDWTLFAYKAVNHGLASLAGYTLSRVGADLVPEDILSAFRTMVDQTRRRNQALFDELARVLDALAREGIETIPLKGPVLAIQAYGDLGLRVFRDLDFLIHDRDLARVIATLRPLGYQRRGPLSAAQFDRIHRLQGQEILFRDGAGNALEPHTRLTAEKTALDIDYAGIWRRAHAVAVGGHTMRLLAPEDELVVLAIHGGKEGWWNIKWACDIAAFIAANPKLDWDAAAARARAQGCLRMLLLALALARRFFASIVPETIVAAERADRAIDPLVERVVVRWLADDAVGAPMGKTPRLELLQLHDGILRRARYLARASFLPGPGHIASVALPKAFWFAYIPLKIVNDAALPIRRACRLVLTQAEKAREAIAGSDLAVATIAASAQTRGSIRRWQKVRADAQRAVEVDPKNASAWRDLGDALTELRRFDQAIACYDKALATTPYNTSTWKKRAAAIEASGGTAEIELAPSDPEDAQAWAVLATRLFSTNRFAEAAEASVRALALDPGNVNAARIGVQARLFACDWRRREDDKRVISEGLRAGQALVSPFFHRAIVDSEAEHLALTRLAADAMPRLEPLWQGERYRHDRIRIAYLSTDFRAHVVSDAMIGCFEHRDKRRFETIAVSLGADDASKMRRRVEGAFDRFIDAEAMSDARTATMMRELEIDIAIDLNGLSGECRTGILARRAAPLQVNYLGYPGTMGVPFMDYIVTDATVIPRDQQSFYAEKIVHLPQTYMPYDNTRQLAARTLTRAEAGLPETAIVFACHNQEYKISPEIYEVWMRLLRSVEDSVLWLKFLNPAAMTNLWREAKARGVAPERVIFAPTVPRSSEHLARLGLADLFLDTLPYNAHATACDALWAGVPVITCAGSTFCGRVAASVLRAVGLPELATASLAEYEELARSLALDRNRLAVLKTKLAGNRTIAPLFDTARFTRNLEAAYTAMHERQQKGLAPESFMIADETV